MTPVAFNSIGYYTYAVFAAINAVMVPVVYFLFPETSGRVSHLTALAFLNGSSPFHCRLSKRLMTSSRRLIPRSLGLLSRLHMTCHFVLPSTVTWIPKVSCFNVLHSVVALT